MRTRRSDGDPEADGPTVSHPGEIPSTGMVTGAVQLPPDGNPIVLMPDHATVGGYPVACCVISADLPVLGQLGPGDTVAFIEVDRGDRPGGPGALGALHGPTGVGVVPDRGRHLTTAGIRAGRSPPLPGSGSGPRRWHHRILPAPHLVRPRAPTRCPVMDLPEWDVGDEYRQPSAGRRPIEREEPAVADGKRPGDDDGGLFQSREDGQLHFLPGTEDLTFPVTAPENATPLEEDEPEGVIPPSPLWAMKERRHEQLLHLFGHPHRIRVCVGSGDAAVYAIDDGTRHCMIGRRVGATPTAASTAWSPG